MVRYGMSRMCGCAIFQKFNNNKKLLLLLFIFILFCVNFFSVLFPSVILFSLQRHILGNDMNVVHVEIIVYLHIYTKNE